MRVESVKRRVKEIVGETLLRTGLWRQRLERMACRGEGIVLTYHRVIEKWDRTLDYSQPGMVVTADTFDRQLHFLKQYFHIVPLSSLVTPPSTLDPRPTARPRPLCALTFDDGWRDNYEIAFPLLRKNNVPATIFLTTDFIGTNRTFWHTQLIYVLLHGELSCLMENDSVLRLYPAAVCHGLAHLARMAEPPSAQDVDPMIRFVEQTCDQGTVNKLIRDLGVGMGLSNPLFRESRFFLDWDQVREMAVAGIEIGSHGCSHRVMTGLNAGDAEDELARSKAEIEKAIGQEVRHFAFPYGVANLDLLELAGRVGYQTACLSTRGLDERRFRPMSLRRLGMHDAVSTGRDGSFSEASFLLWLFRAPRIRVVGIRRLVQDVGDD